MKLSACTLVMACLLHATPCLGQASRRASTNSPAGEGLSQLSGREPRYADPTTRRLEILTEIWGNTGLFHPIPSSLHLKWDDVLVDALRSMPSVHSDREFVDLLNRVVFAPLHDPLAYAAIRSEASFADARRLEGRWLDSSTAYVRAADDLGTAAFARRVRLVIDSLTKARVPVRLVVDLRSPVQGAYFLAAPWLGMWAREQIPRGSDLSIFRSTELPLGAGTWLVTPWDSLAPIPPAISVPTVFVVNRTTYPAVERSLDALRAHRADLAIIFEESGGVPIIWGREHAPQLLYPDSILLSVTRLPIYSADGALGSVVDISSPSAIPIDDISRVAARALAARSATQPRRPVALTPPRIRDDSVSMGPLSREQRLAGVLKTWFWVLHFYAYVDDIGEDWRRVLKTVVPQVEAVGSDTAYYRILAQMIGTLNDTHAGITHPLADGPGSPFRAFSVPLTFAWVDHKLAVVRVDTTIGVAPGDEVIAIDGKPVQQAAAEARRFWSLSRPDADVPIFFLMGLQNSTLRLRLRSTSGVHDVILPRSRRFDYRNNTRLFTHPAYSILPGNLGFIDLGQMASPSTIDSAMTALADTRGLVLDERAAAAYDGQAIVYRFISDPIPCMRSLENISYVGYQPGAIQAVGSMQCTTMPPIVRTAPIYTKPIVVMTSRANISYGESLAQKLRVAKRATFVGEPTNGTFGTKDGITLPGGATVWFTRGRTLWPTGAKYHGIGVVPDVPVQPTLTGLRHGRDEVFETALATLRSLLTR